MLKTIQLLVLSFLLSSVLSGQRVAFEVIGKANFLKNEAYTNITEFDGTFTEILNDSMLLRSSGMLINTNIKNYSPNVGYEVHGRVAISLSDRIRIRTGIGLNYTSFSISNDFVGSKWTETSVDTVDWITNTGNPPGGIDPCDVYDNLSFDLDEINRDIQNTIVNLIIPLELGYEIIPDKLRTHFGVFFQTPVYTSTKREYIRLNKETEDGITRCSFEKLVDENRSGDGFNNMQFGLSVSVQYEIIKGIGIEIGLSKAMTSVFTRKEYQSSRRANGVYKPFALTAGISYRFGTHINPDPSN